MDKEATIQCFHTNFEYHIDIIYAPLLQLRCSVHYPNVKNNLTTNLYNQMSKLKRKLLLLKHRKQKMLKKNLLS